MSRLSSCHVALQAPVLCYTRFDQHSAIKDRKISLIAVTHKPYHC